MNIQDPKRPKNIKFFRREQQSEENGDFFQIISLMFGVVSFLLKVKSQKIIKKGKMGNLD